MFQLQGKLDTQSPDHVLRIHLSDCDNCVLHRSECADAAMIGLQVLDLALRRGTEHVQTIKNCLVHNLATLARYDAVMPGLLCTAGLLISKGSVSVLHSVSCISM